MKVFILVEDSAYDFDQNHRIVGVYANLEKAKEAFKSCVSNAKAENEDLTEIEETETQFEMYEEGRYAENRICYEIVEEEIQ